MFKVRLILALPFFMLNTYFCIMRTKPINIKPASKQVENKMLEQGTWMILNKKVKNKDGSTSLEYYALKIGIN